MTILTILRDSKICSIKFVRGRELGEEILKSSRFRIRHQASNIKYQTSQSPIYLTKYVESSRTCGIHSCLKIWENINKVFSSKYWWGIGRDWVNYKKDISWYYCGRSLENPVICLISLEDLLHFFSPGNY